MIKKSKFHKTSLYCPDDKDIYDFLKATGATTEKMTAFLRRQGILLSKNADAEDMRTTISQLVLGWNQISELIEIVDIRESKERLIPKFLKSSISADDIIQALRDVESTRQKRFVESYKIHPSSNGDKISVNVDYLAVRNERNRLTQKENETLTFHLTKSNGGYNIMHTNNETAAAIYETLRGTLADLKKTENEKSKEIESISISLKDVLDPKSRVKFFRLVSENISGFTYETMLDVKVTRLPRGLRAPTPSDEDAEAEDEDAERIRRVIISGKDLHRTKQLTEYFDQGFFISGMSWQSLHKDTDVLIDFYAGFRDQQNADDYEFCVHGKHSRTNGEFLETRENLPRPTADAYCSLLQNASFIAYETIKAEVPAFRI